MTWTKKDSNNRKVVEGYLSTDLVKDVYKLMDRKVFDEVVGLVNEGKESTILLVKSEGKNLAMKIHKIEASKFQRMQQYMYGDRRFSKIKNTKRSMVHAWAKKEFSNLQRAHNAGVACPQAYAFYNNIIVLDFIGKENIPAQKLKDAHVDNTEDFFDQTIENYRLLYTKAGLVHGDLSEYNVLVLDNKPVFIDFAQSVLLDHPRADEFLKRDVENLCNSFKKLGVKRDPDEIVKAVRKTG